RPAVWFARKTGGRRAMSYEAITYETRGHVGIVTLNRPERLNAISQALRSEVTAAFKAARDDDNIRVLILTGAGRGFCSGADLSAPRDAQGRPVVPASTGQNERLDE